MQAMSSTTGATGAPGSQGLGKLLVPGLLVLIVVLYVVSLIGIGMTIPSDVDHQKLTRPVISWAAIGMFDTVLIFPTGLLAAMKLGPKKR